MIEKAPKDVPHANTAFSGGSFRRTSQAYPAEKFYQDMISLSGEEEPILSSPKSWWKNLGKRATG